MRYYGGKGVVGKRIASVILKIIEGVGSTGRCPENGERETIYIEPFCGALGVLRYVSGHVSKCYANDISKDMILLHRSLKNNKFQNPKINKGKWIALKYSTKPSAERAFAGHGCSYGGVWFNGYIDDPSNNDMIYSSLIRIAPKLQNVVFSSESYVNFLKDFHFVKGKQYIIYMDPPYKGTCNIPFEKKQDFDSNQFWDIVRKLSKTKGITVLVSEISAPRDFKCIYKFDRKNGMHNVGTNQTVIKEKLYVLRTE
jgi:DNA adenine methylase